jgi:hypothetical protein
MAEHTGHDLVSKCVAIQYGLLVAGVVLLVVATWSWYQNWSKPALADCKAAHAACVVAAKAAAAPTDSSPQVSQFASRKSIPSSGKITENMLHEGFLHYRADESQFDTEATRSPADVDLESGAYDPAQMSLDQSVFDSHNEFVEESYSSTQGPSSANIERDDTNEVVKRVGLRRVDYSSVYSSDDARTVSSEYPEQVQQGTGPTDDSGLF